MDIRLTEEQISRNKNLVENDPESLVGRRIVIKAMNSKNWFLAEITDWNERRSTHEIEYDDGQEAACKVVQAHLMERDWTFEGDVEEDDNYFEQDQLLSQSANERVDDLLGEDGTAPSTPITKPSIAFEVGGIKFSGSVK